LQVAASKGRFREQAERVRKDGTRFWASVSVTALHNDKGELRGFTQVIRDISEQKRSTRAVAESRARLIGIVESAMDAIVTVDSDQRIVLFNAAAEAMFGHPVSGIIGKPLAQLIPQRSRDAHAGHVRAFATTGVTSRAMGQLGTLSGLRSDGTEFPIEASISQTDVGGNKFFTVILRDITARKQADARQSLLLGELAHRVKNTLAVVQSIAAQTRRFAVPEQFYDKFAGRLAALGTAHDMLTRSEWEGAALADIVAFGIRPYDGLGSVQRWTIEGPAIWLAPNEAVTLSLAFHELATNAAKYGALSGGNGTVDVRWSLDMNAEPPAVAMHSCERGGPLVSSPSRRGFGSRLLEQAIAHELNGQTQVDFTPAGLECWLRFPLSPKVKVQP
jgi:PAS domain S-box-containing protein